MKCFLVVLAAVIMMIAVAAQAGIRRVGQTYKPNLQVVKMTEADWESFNQGVQIGYGPADNSVAWYFIGSSIINTQPGETIYPMDSQVYTDVARVSIWWDYYVFSANLIIGDLSARLVDENYSVLTDYVQFDSVGLNLWRARFFELPLAYVMRPNCNNIVKLELFVENWVTEPCEWTFQMIPSTVRMSPGTINVWPASGLQGSAVYVAGTAQQGELYVTAEANPLSTNVIAGASDVPVLGLRAHAVNSAYEILQVPIFQADSTIYHRSMQSVTISFQNQAGQQTTITEPLNVVNGTAYLDLSTVPWFIPENSFRIAQVYFNLNTINQTFGAYTGDCIKAGFDANLGFIAKNLVSNQFVFQTTNNVDVIGNQMVVHGNVPTIIVDAYTNTNLINGQVELYRWTVTAAEGGTNVYFGQHTLRMLMIDTVPTAASLGLSNFMVYEGPSYAAVAPLVPATSGADSYEVYRQTGDVLSGSPYTLYANSTGDTVQSIVITYYDDRVIPAGTTMYYILKACAENVNTGASSNDFISCYMYDGDMNYAPPLAADFHPEDPLWYFGYVNDVYFGAVLDDNPTTLLGNEFMSWIIWSDGTGTWGNNNHVQSLYNGGPSSLDWFNGHLIKNLGLVRILSATAVDGTDQTIEVKPSEFKVGNYPNPFNPETKITFAFPEAVNVSLIIYDITGREVARLVDGYYSAGEHSAVFDGTNLSSGIYFYRLSAGEYSAVKKMMLVK